MAMGGIVPYRMQEGRTVPGAAIAGTGTAFSGAEAFGRLFRSPQYVVERKAAELIQRGRPQEAMALLQENNINPKKVFDSVQAPSAPPAAAPPAAAPPAAAPASFNAMPDQRQSFSLSPNYGMPSVPSNAPQRNAPPRDIVDKGIPAVGAAMNASRQQAGADNLRQQTGAGTSPIGYLNSLFAPQARPAEVQAAIDLQRQQMEQGLPPPIDLNQYIQSAQQRQQEARDEARQMAIANTLMNLGTGLFAGDPAAGLQRATQAATETLREGRREAQAEGRMAEQLQLQAAQQNRQNILDTMKFKSESVNAIANIISGEQRADRETKMQAAQIVATYNAALDRNRSELAQQGRLDERSQRTARTAALQSAGDAYLSNPINTTGKTSEEIATEISKMARLLDPEAFGSSGSSAATQSRSSRFTVNEVARTGR
jgi:hypothetical protein